MAAPLPMTSILGRVLPVRMDNDYRGLLPGLWVFGGLVVMRGLIGLNCIFRGEYVASHADGIPMASFAPAALRMIVSDFATWGLMQVMLCLISIVALVRYRAMVPLLLFVFLLEHVCRKLIIYALPIARSADAPGSYVNLVIFALEIGGLALALWPRGGKALPV